MVKEIQQTEDSSELQLHYMKYQLTATHVGLDGPMAVQQNYIMLHNYL